MVQAKLMLVLVVLLYPLGSVETQLPTTQAPTLEWDEVYALRAFMYNLGLATVPYISPFYCTEGTHRGYNIMVICNCTYNNSTTCHVTSIEANSLDLAGGSIHKNVSKLKYLQRLDLGNNKLSGSIPESLGDLPALVRLTLYKNLLTGPIPSSLGKLINLKILTLYRNRLSDPIPKELGNLTNLETLRLEQNQLTGNIPPELGLAWRIKELRLADNQLVGIIPSELGNIINLLEFDLTSNNLTGPLPKNFERLARLQYFLVAGNKLTGRIPTFIAKKWTDLISIILIGNEFEGELPLEFFKMENLQYLYVSDLRNSNFTFPDRADMTNMKQLYKIILRNCSISGQIPYYIGNWPSLKYIDLSFNKLIGEIPNSFQKLNLSSMFLASNMLGGTIPPWISKIPKVELSYNNFTSSTKDLKIKKIPGHELNINPKSRNAILEMGNEHCQGKSKYNSLYINCGGPRLEINPDIDKGIEERILYDQDNSTSKFEKGPAGKWVYTCSGDFVSTTSSSSDYLQNMTCGVSDNSLYRTARYCSVALTYYAFCLHKGNYTVKLHLAETVYAKNEDYSISGKRIFDVYIQGEKREQDFDIKEKTQGPNEEYPLKYSTVVKDNLLEIQLYWAGKGSLYNPPALNGPLLSAISVTPRHKNKLSSAQIARITLGSVFTPLLLLAFMWRLEVHRRAMKELDEIKINFRGKDVTLRKIIDATQNFSTTNRIGGGRFGEVYKAELKDQQITLAVKKIHHKLLQQEKKEELHKEISSQTSFSHENLVKMLLCNSKGDRCLLIYEFMDNGTLHAALFDESRPKPGWKTRLDICLGIAKGLKYLHEENKVKIVHGDVTSENVMLDANYTAKLSDFGLAMAYDDEPFLTLKARHKLVAMAPECAYVPASVEADVYSFGHLLLEIVTGRRSSVQKPDKVEILMHEAKDYQDRGMILELVDKMVQESSEKDQAQAILELALKCFSYAPNSRPKMYYIVNELGRIIRKDKPSFRRKFGGCFV